MRLKHLKREVQFSILKIKDRSAFCVDHIFELQQESEDEINGKPNSEGGEREVNEKQADIFRTHSESVGKPGRYVEPVSLKEIPNIVDGFFHLAKILFFVQDLYSQSAGKAPVAVAVFLFKFQQRLAV